MDVALLHLPSAIDIDPTDLNPTVIPFLAGTPNDLSGKILEQIGFGYRDLRNLQYCGQDSDCPGSDGRCDLVTALPGRSQCYRNFDTVAPSSGACSTKVQCPKGFDCDQARNVCYQAHGFVNRNTSSHCSSNNSCGPWNRLCDPNGNFCADPAGCTADYECPGGYVCVDIGNDTLGPRRQCIEPSVISAAPQCNMTVSCAGNNDCFAPTSLCVDGHCCPNMRGLRTAQEPVTGLIQLRLGRSVLSQRRLGRRRLRRNHAAVCVQGLGDRRHGADDQREARRAQTAG